MKKGFSLIELLVVMVIIGILAGIGIAQFKNQRQKATEAKIAAECALAQRCEDLRNSCLKGGDTGCNSLCDASAITCKIKYKGGSNADSFLNNVSGVITGGSQELFTTANWVRAWSRDPVFAAGKNGYIEFQVSNANAYFGIGLRDYQASSFRADAFEYGFLVNGLDHSPARHSVGHYSWNPSWTFDSSDVFRIQKVGNNILMRKNGVSFHSYSITDEDLYFVFSSRFAGQQLENVQMLEY